MTPKLAPLSPRPMERLCDLWEGPEYHTVTVWYEPGYGTNPAQWHVGLDARWDGSYKIDDPHGADWVTLTWSFYGDDVDEAAREALAFAEALVVLDQTSCEHESATGVDQTDADDPRKVWRCDNCGWRFVDVVVDGCIVSRNPAP
jgi:hypothetical protein